MLGLVLVGAQSSFCPFGYRGEEALTPKLTPPTITNRSKNIPTSAEPDAFASRPSPRTTHLTDAPVAWCNVQLALSAVVVCVLTPQRYDKLFFQSIGVVKVFLSTFAGTNNRNMKKLFRYREDFGRMGDLHGVFVAEEADVDKAMGTEVYFGEVLGKHSEIVGSISSNTITVLTDDQDFIAKAEGYGVASAGFNPLDYVEQED
jgi:hypothetical protein